MVSNINKSISKKLNQISRVRVSNVGKIFGKSLNRNRKIIAHEMVKSLFTLRTSYKESNKDFWALKDVNLNVLNGESVALIGNNGAGKSTLLKIMAGHLKPTDGEVKITGNVAELTSMSSGYQANLSGRENILLAGALRGFKKSHMLAISQDIIDFSEIEEYIDSPFGTYSAGMKMRLAFSVASHVQPDILFIDEALAVGDLRFRNKCLGRLHRMKKNTTFILVTHSMAAVYDFCDRVIVMDKGRIVFDGKSKEGILVYQGLNRSSLQTVNNGPELTNPNQISLIDAYWINNKGEKIEAHSLNNNWIFKVIVKIYKPIVDPIVSIMIYDKSGNQIVSLSDPNNKLFLQLQQEGKYEITINICKPRLQGAFSTVLAIRDGPELLYRKRFKLMRTIPETARSWGILKVDSDWAICSVE